MHRVAGERRRGHYFLGHEELGKGFDLGRDFEGAQTAEHFQGRLGIGEIRGRKFVDHLARPEMKSSCADLCVFHHSRLLARQPMLLSLVRVLTQAEKKLVSR